MLPCCLCVSVILSLRPCGGGAVALQTTGSFAQDDHCLWLFAGSQRLSLRRICDSDADHRKLDRSFGRSSLRMTLTEEQTPRERILGGKAQLGLGGGVGDQVA